MNKIFLEKRKGTSQPFLEKNVFKKRKAISPLIAVILIIVVAVALIAIILNWGKSFTTSSLDDTRSIADLRVSDATHFIFNPTYRKTTLTFTYSPPSNLKNKEITIDRYTIVGSTEIYDLNSPLVLIDGYNGIVDLNLDMFTIVDKKIDVVLISINDEYITLKNTSYFGDTSCPTCPEGTAPIVPLDLPYVYYPLGQTNTVLYINTFDRTGTADWATAVSYCDTLEVHGYSDWYLPDVAQMMSIWLACPNTDKSNLCMNNNIQNKITGWSDMVINWYWTTTEFSSSGAYRLTMHYGDINLGNKGTFNDVRCVRDH